MRLKSYLLANEFSDKSYEKQWSYVVKEELTLKNHIFISNRTAFIKKGHEEKFDKKVKKTRYYRRLVGEITALGGYIKKTDFTYRQFNSVIEENPHLNEYITERTTRGDIFVKTSCFENFKDDFEKTETYKDIKKIKESYTNFTTHLKAKGFSTNDTLILRDEPRLAKYREFIRENYYIKNDNLNEFDNDLERSDKYKKIMERNGAGPCVKIMSVRKKHRLSRNLFRAILKNHPELEGYVIKGWRGGGDLLRKNELPVFEEILVQTPEYKNAKVHIPLSDLLVGPGIDRIKIDTLLQKLVREKPEINDILIRRGSPYPVLVKEGETERFFEILESLDKQKAEKTDEKEIEVTKREPLERTSVAKDGKIISLTDSRLAYLKLIITREMRFSYNGLLPFDPDNSEVDGISRIWSELESKYNFLKKKDGKHKYGSLHLQGKINDLRKVVKEIKEELLGDHDEFNEYTETDDRTTLPWSEISAGYGGKTTRNEEKAIQLTMKELGEIPN